MTHPHLSTKIRDKLDTIATREINKDTSYAFWHEIGWYGIDAIIHIYLMQKAQNISQGNISLSEFVSKYKLEFNQEYGFMTSLDAIKSDGIFIPRHSYIACDCIHNTRTLFFHDYLNRVAREEWVDKNNARELIDRKWISSDLENPELVESGIQFGKDMFKTCVAGFYKYMNGNPGMNIPKQQEKMTYIGTKYISYYSTLIL